MFVWHGDTVVCLSLTSRCTCAEHIANPWGVNVFTLEHARIN